MENIAVIPLRGASKSIPDKNIKPMAGRPMALWSIDAAVNCKYINLVIVPTDSDKIRGVLLDYLNPKLKIISRSHESATDSAPSEMVLMDIARKYDCDKIALIQATSPLLSADDLNSAFEEMAEKKADSALSVVKQKRFIWELDGDFAKPFNYNPFKRPMRQNFNGFLVENGAFYITDRKMLLKTGCRLSGNVIACQMTEDSYHELDEPHDWFIIEQLLMRRIGQNKMLSFNRTIKLVVMDLDGVMTDGGMYYSSNGDEIKKFNTKDGMGIGLLRKAGLRTAIITGESNSLILKRAEKLKIDIVRMGVEDKLSALKDICKALNILMDEVAYVGDDINDLQCVESVGLSLCPSDAAQPVMRKARVVLSKKGGDGCVREASDMILSIKNPENAG